MVTTRSSPAKAAAAGKTAMRRQAVMAEAAAVAPDMRVLIAYTGASAGESGAAAAVDVRCFTLPHPRTGAPAAFMAAGGRLLELNVQRPSHAAWFAGDAVIGDGGLHMATPVDPLFLLLPLLDAAAEQVWTLMKTGAEDAESLRKHLLLSSRFSSVPLRPPLAAAAGQGMFREAEEVLEAAPAPGFRHLAGVAAAASAAVCDSQEAGGQTFLRLNDDKALAWLKCKVDAAAAALAATASGAYAGVDAASLQHYAVALLSEWLAPSRHAALQLALGIAADDAGQPAELPQPLPPRSEERPQKRLRLDPKEISKRRAAEAKAEAKAARVAKETRGMKKMSAFFKKPASAAKAAA